MNIEHRTSNIERRRMKSLCSVDFYKNDTPEAYHNSTLDVRCSMLDVHLLFRLNVYFYQFIQIGFAYLIAGLITCKCSKINKIDGSKKSSLR